MSRRWHLRMSSAHHGEKNSVADLTVEQEQEDGSWKPLTIGLSSPGFLIFVYSLFTCQHLYMYANASEHGLLLEKSSGTLELVAGQDWMLQDLRVAFEATLRTGTPTAEAIADIEGRMNQCPVSRNIHCSGVHESRLRFV